MNVVPAVTPVITPEVAPTVAIEGSLVDHASPPEVMSVTTEVPPTQAILEPEIAAGSGLTVTAEALAQPLVSV